MSRFFDLPFEEPEPEPEPEPESPPPPARRVLTVTELTTQIRTLLEERFFEVWVEGELSNCRIWNTGHMYFTLKDSSAQIRGAMFRMAMSRLRFKPHDGLRVVARGRVSVYDPKGEYQILCEHLEPEGLGARQLAFEQLKKRLAAEGLFDPRRKRTLPSLPRKIGIVTSLDGAAIRDIIKVLRRRYANGLDALMWGTDYPHPEGTWPNTVTRLTTDFQAVPVEETRLLLGLNAVRCYDLDLDALTAIAAEIGPTPTQLNQDLDRRTPPNAVREARFWFDDYGIEWKG